LSYLFLHFVYPLGFAFSYDPTGRESHAEGGQADVYPPLAEYPISCVAKGSQ
jgi:hypothetical protein